MRKVSKTIHFMGIGGSALSGVAIMAKKQGFSVSGCDIATSTAYLDNVKKENIKVYEGHNRDHLRGVDVLAVSPAILYQNLKHPEYVEAKKQGIADTWDEFVGNYLLEDKEVVCVAGTHGKSTTTALASLVFTEAGLDPSVIIGATTKEWNGNYRVGKDKYFIIEADEFFEKFLKYKPSTIILNNIEFDHPDFFHSEDDMIASYVKFVKLLSGQKNLIVNQDSKGIKNLLERLDKKFVESINIYGYTLTNNPIVKIDKSARATIIKRGSDTTKFKFEFPLFHQNDIYNLRISGDYNVSNSAGVIILASIYDISKKDIDSVFTSFAGIGRRMELLGARKGISVYDDYAHHPTAIKATILALKQRHPGSRILVVDEPHSFSRTNALLNQYSGVFDEADKVIIGPIYKARDKKTIGVTGQSVVNISKHKDIIYLNEISTIIETLKKELKPGDIILVMGAGDSYKWARDILESL